MSAKAGNNGDCGDDVAGGSVTGGGNGLPAAGVTSKPDRAKKRRRGRGIAVDRDAESVDSYLFLSPEVAATAAAAATVGATPATPEPMDEGEEGGLPAGSAADEVSAGEGLAEPGDGGQPAQRFGGGGVSEGTGGGGGGQLLGAAMFGEEEGEYAADSERSTDHESMHIYSGGGRESDEHETSERHVFQRGRGRSGGRRGRGRKGAQAVSQHGLRVGTRTPSPEAGLDGDAENSSSRQYVTGASGSCEGEGSSSPKRRRVGGAARLRGRRGGRDGVIRDADEVGEEHSESRAHSEEASGSGGGGGGRAGGGEEGHEGDVEDVEGGAAAGGDGRRGGIIPGVELEWKAKQGRQPIFMSRGLPEAHPGLPSHSDEGDNGPRIPGRSGVGGKSVKPLPDPEDDRDRASSCSSADSLSPRVAGRVGRSGGIIVRPGSRGTRRVRGVGFVGGGGGGMGIADDGDEQERDGSPADKATIGGVGGSRDDSATIFDGGDAQLQKATPNSPGGVVPWHHTSVYEANNPTEDRHVELAHDAIGVRIYCVCDGHGGSRAAQFVCDNLAGDVLARVLAMAEGAHGAHSGQRGRAAAIGSTKGFRGDSTDGAGNGDGWTANDEEVRRTLADAFSCCDERFIAQLDPRKNRGYINAGCCVVLALLIRSKLYVAHVGDCRVVLGTTDGARFPPDLLTTTSTTTSPTATQTDSVAAGTAAMDGADAAMDGGSGEGRASDDRGKSGTAGARNASAAAASINRRATSPANSATYGGAVLAGGVGGGGGAPVAEGKLVAVALSRDHNCDDADEAALVRARSGDENAIRVSRNDEGKGPRAIKRVAGSLAVTRAIGDAYLKEAVFSFSPYKVRFTVLFCSLLFLFF